MGFLFGNLDVGTGFVMYRLECGVKLRNDHKCAKANFICTENFNEIKRFIY